jgi:hypothetical protein
MMKQAVILPPAETDRRRNFLGSKQTADEASAHFAQDASASADGFTLSWSKVQSRLRKFGKGLHEFGEITMQRLSGFRLQKNFLSIAKGQTPKSIPFRLVKPAIAYRNLPPGSDSAGGYGGRIDKRAAANFSLAGLDGRTREATGSICLLVEVFVDIFFPWVLS